uniref:Uncharacterized protein n=1 Tax=Arundo donax TaxID=35708 RepID=A0A0A9GEH3_ARUDO
MPPSKPKRRRLLPWPEEAEAPRRDLRRRAAGPSSAVPGRRRRRRLRRGGSPPEHAGAPRAGRARHLAAPFPTPQEAPPRRRRGGF